MGSVHFSVEANIATLVLDNEAERNAVDRDMAEALTGAYRQIEHDDEIRVAIITGAGDKAFCAGGSLGGYLDSDVLGPDGTGRRSHLPKPYPLWKPFIAAIRGYAVAGGFGLALSCDLRVLGRSAVVGPSGLRLGVVQGAQQTQRLVRLLGLAPALELLLLSKHIPANEAYRIGLAHAVVDDDAVLDTAREWATTIASYSPWAVAKTKQLAYEGQHLALQEALDWEEEVQVESLQRPEAVEGFERWRHRPSPPPP